MQYVRADAHQGKANCESLLTTRVHFDWGRCWLVVYLQTACGSVVSRSWVTLGEDSGEDGHKVSL